MSFELKRSKKVVRKKRRRNKPNPEDYLLKVEANMVVEALELAKRRKVEYVA